MREEDAVDLPSDDFRRLRRYLAPWVFADGNDLDRWPDPSDPVRKESWDSIMDLATDVAIRSTSYEGTLVARLEELQSDWIFSWPEPNEAPFMNEPALLAGEEFDALVFNAVHGYYRQAIGCLRNALEILTVAAGLALTNNQALFRKWREDGQEIGYGQARAWLRDSPEGKRVDADAAPDSIFGNDDASWSMRRYTTLCAYAHSRAGSNNADFWESNGPVFRPKALRVVEAEFRETLGLSYLLVRLRGQLTSQRRDSRNCLLLHIQGGGSTT